MPGFDGTGPSGMGPMTGGARGWCNLYSPPYAAYAPYAAPYPPAYGSYYAPTAGIPAWGYGFRPYRGYGLGRPRWGLGGLWVRGMGWAGRGRRRWW